MKNSILKNKKGQFLVEYVLLMVISVSVFMGLIKYAQENKWAYQFISGPWSRLSGMVEAGVWEDPSTAKGKHPNQINRSVSWVPK